MKSAYIYPFSSRATKLGTYNPYVDDFVESMGNYCKFVNKYNPSTSGIFDFLKYLFRTDVIFFNWIEDIPEKKGGFAQALFLLFLLSITNIFKIKVIWTMHNKLSHSHEKLFLKKIIFRSLLKKTHWIITHSSEGVQYAEIIAPGSQKKTLYLPHPIKYGVKKSNVGKKIDILIWGTIFPYKHILEFLEYLYKIQYKNKYKILVIGRAISKEYFNLLLRYSNRNIIIKNEYPSNESLQSIFGQSRLVLFPYAKSSILSSGALMHSLGFDARIIGPNVGAFTDLAKEGLVRIFDDFEELVSIVDDELSNEYHNGNSKVDSFARDNSWDKYAEKLSKILFEGAEPLGSAS